MSRNQWWTVTLNDGSTDDVYGTPIFNVTNTVVYFQQHYSGSPATSGVIPDRTVTYPLANVRKWEVRKP